MSEVVGQCQNCGESLTSDHDCRAAQIVRDWVNRSGDEAAEIDIAAKIASALDQAKRSGWCAKRGFHRIPPLGLECIECGKKLTPQQAIENEQRKAAKMDRRLSDAPVQEPLHHRMLMSCAMGVHDDAPYTTLPESTLHEWAGEVERQAARIATLEQSEQALSKDIAARIMDHAKAEQDKEELLGALREVIITAARAALVKHPGSS